MSVLFGANWEFQYLRLLLSPCVKDTKGIESTAKENIMLFMIVSLKILEYLKLPFAPYATQLDANKNMIVVTSDNLLSVNRLGSVDTLVKEGFWSSLYPTSMVIHKNICYVGMRQAVLKFDLFTKKQEWLMPK